MEIGILIDQEFKRALTAVWLEKVAGQVLLAEHVNPLVEIGLVVTGQDKIQELNRLYLEEDTPTDVLSFPMTESDVDGNSFITPPDNALHLGEVVISYPQAKKQAKEHGHTVKKEVAVLIIHGVLHLLGYDHDTPGHRRVMRKREAAIMKIIEEKLL
ncbi:MAG: rRNA maturation RNase YbeY [Dehalococcoidales bacterium]|nr:rRNA maturation RNase YbeY [Dehalococcoidales bacterium]